MFHRNVPFTEVQSPTSKSCVGRFWSKKEVWTNRQSNISDWFIKSEFITFVLTYSDTAPRSWHEMSQRRGAVSFEYESDRERIVTIFNRFLSREKHHYIEKDATPRSWHEMYKIIFDNSIFDRVFVHESFYNSILASQDYYLSDCCRVFSIWATPSINKFVKMWNDWEVSLWW